MDIVQAEGCFQRRKQSKQREPRKRSDEGYAQEKEVVFGVDALPCHYFDSRRSIGVLAGAAGTSRRGEKLVGFGSFWEGGEGKGIGWAVWGAAGAARRSF